MLCYNSQVKPYVILAWALFQRSLTCNIIPNVIACPLPHNIKNNIITQSESGGERDRELKQCSQVSVSLSPIRQQLTLYLIVWPNASHYGGRSVHDIIRTKRHISMQTLYSPYSNLSFTNTSCAFLIIRHYMCSHCKTLRVEKSVSGFCPYISMMVHIASSLCVSTLGFSRLAFVCDFIALSNVAELTRWREREIKVPAKTERGINNAI